MGRGRCERSIGDAEGHRAGELAHRASFALNEVWLTLVLMAGDLLAWMKGLCLEGALAKAEPKRLRYTLLHTAGLHGALGPAHHRAHRGGLARGPTRSSRRSGDYRAGPPPSPDLTAAHWRSPRAGPLDRHAPKRSSVHRTFGSASDHLAPRPLPGRRRSPRTAGRVLGGVTERSGLVEQSYSLSERLSGGSDTAGLSSVSRFWLSPPPRQAWD